MEERATVERTYVTKDEYEANNRLVDEKFNRVLTVIEKNFELTNEKIEHVVDTLTVAINDTNRRTIFMVYCVWGISCGSTYSGCCGGSIHEEITLNEGINYRFGESKILRLANQSIQSH